jgi:hypothetical protein
LKLLDSRFRGNDVSKQIHGFYESIFYDESTQYQPSSRLWLCLALFAVLALGFFVRFDNLGHWRSNPERYFFGEQQNPLTLTVDAYYFMDGARDISHGRYTALDEDRLAPTGYQRSAWPPLISVVLAGVTGLTGISLEWGAVLLPPFFSLFLGIAAFLLGRELGMRVQHRLIDERYRRTAAGDYGPCHRSCHPALTGAGNLAARWDGSIPIPSTLPLYQRRVFQSALQLRQEWKRASPLVHPLGF